MTIIIAGTITIDPAKVDQALADAAEAMKATHQEEGNLAYVFSASPIEPGVLHLFEKWESDANLGPHSQAEHFKTLQSKMAGWGVKGADVKKYVIESEGPLFG